jgi:hypothetical protein
MELLVLALELWPIVPQLVRQAWDIGQQIRGAGMLMGRMGYFTNVPQTTCGKNIMNLYLIHIH